jgi:type IV pilus assembly protein PilA
MKNQKGFSLVELLVVVIIIAIIAAIAIPSLLASRRAANEASAINSLRTIHSAQATYQAIAGNSVNYGTAAQLGPAGQGLIDANLAALSKSGYAFTITAVAADNTDPLNPIAGSYCADATPANSTSGTRGFAVGVQGVIYENPTAAPDCADGIVDAGTGTPLQ